MIGINDNALYTIEMISPDGSTLKIEIAVYNIEVRPKLIENDITKMGILWNFSVILKRRRINQPGRKNNVIKEKIYTKISLNSDEPCKKFNVMRTNPEKTNRKSTAL